MTCIVGLEHNGHVYMGADAAAVETESLDAFSTTDEKVFLLEDSMILGYTTSFRMGQLLQYGMVLPEKSARKTDVAYLVTDFADAVRGLLRDRGFLRTDEGAEVGGQFLVGFNGKLYMVCIGFEVVHPLMGYFAVGCGAPYALGAMAATEGSRKTPEQRIETALRAASRHNAGVREPFTIKCLPPAALASR